MPYRPRIAASGVRIHEGSKILVSKREILTGVHSTFCLRLLPLEYIGAFAGGIYMIEHPHYGGLLRPVQHDAAVHVARMHAVVGEYRIHIIKLDLPRNFDREVPVVKGEVGRYRQLSKKTLTSSDNCWCTNEILLQ